MYLADYGQLTYENTRQNSFNTLKVSRIESFLSWVEAKVLKDKWSFDATVGYAMCNSLFVCNEMVCTKTLYNYLHQGLLRVKAMDLPGINWCNNLPRKLLHYKTPQEVFIEEINKVMDLESVQFHIAI